MTFKFYDKELKDIHTLSVDGIAPLGTNLSHWPENRTPENLKADTSTQICFNYIKQLRSREYSKGHKEAHKEEAHKEDILTINHYDTDGFLSLCVILYPELALKHQNLLIDSAITGDFRRFRGMHPLKIDLSVCAFKNDTQIAKTLTNVTNEVQKRQIMYDELLKLFPTFLSYEQLDKQFRYLWYKEEKQIVEELINKNADITFYKDIDLAIIESDSKLHEITINTFTYPASRILSITYNKKENINKYNFMYTVDSWFEIVSRKVSKRLALEPMTNAFNDLEQNTSWTCTSIKDPTPCLSHEGSSKISKSTLVYILTQFLSKQKERETKQQTKKQTKKQ